MTTQVPDDFFALSSALTGFSQETLTFAQQAADFYTEFQTAYGTATLDQMVETYLAQIQAGRTPEQAAAFILDETQDQAQADAARALIVFWYLGQIGTAADPDKLHIPGSNFFAQGLAWRAVQAHPPAVSTQKFGYWATPPAPLRDYLR
jgi:hypothetical protein